MRKLSRLLVLILWLALWAQAMATDVVDYVNPYMGNISHLLKPTYPTVHLPYGMLRFYPNRGSHVEGKVSGLPLIVVNHRENSCFALSVTQTEGQLHPIMRTDYDNEQIKPYYYSSDLDEQRVTVEMSPLQHSAIYKLQFNEVQPGFLLLNSGNGEMQVQGKCITGYQNTWGGVRVYLYAEVDRAPVATGALQGHRLDDTQHSASGDNACVVLQYPGKSVVNLRYAVSYISTEQAQRNFDAEVAKKSLEQVMEQGRNVWNQELGKITVTGGTVNDRAVFYTSLYRCMERPVCISEQGQYFCPADHQVHSDEGHPFYTDDWLWDTYRAAHPLRMLIDPERETDMIRSLLRTAEHDPRHWFPTFPAVTGDSRRMNCNHGVAVVADAWGKGLHDFDLAKAYDYCRRGIEEKTLAPWSSHDATWLDTFYRDHGYIPALKPGERENVPGVNSWEKRQPVAVTLGTSYDQWCLSQIATALGRNDEARHYLRCSYNYRNLFNPATSFFHPKDKDGQWIEPFDYRFSGGIGAREYYDENNGWTYRWDVQHNPADLVNLMGGREAFVKNLDQTFDEWLGTERYNFYHQLPDQTGNVGQFTMGNEPSMHIPYLYNYAGQPWKTQKRVRELVHQWFRNDLMGMPGDEDGGGLSGFVVFSMMGFYPVTPGLPVYNLGSPFFNDIRISLAGGKVLNIQAPSASEQAKYIMSATINGQPCNRPWFNHEDIQNGGTIMLNMSSRHTDWGSDIGAMPPSALPYPHH